MLIVSGFFFAPPPVAYQDLSWTHSGPKAPQIFTTPMATPGNGPCTFASENTKLLTHCPVNKSCVVGVIIANVKLPEYSQNFTMTPNHLHHVAFIVNMDNVSIFNCLPVVCFQQYWSDHFSSGKYNNCKAEYSKAIFQTFQKENFFLNLAPINDL